MVMKIWSQVIMDFQEIWMKEILPSLADPKLWCLTAACHKWGIPAASRTHPTETSPSAWSCTTLTSFWCPPRGSSLWQRTDTFMLRCLLPRLIKNWDLPSKRALSLRIRTLIGCLITPSLRIFVLKMNL
uniref:Transforming growth factor beta receptor 3 n=1 Tax=Rousettus aegyptiacus TaxID=9407 RepID=A0A7J8KIB7_ROUAE|nr:transforming growth factor beta receptor 3 [Rousettus aegyptiacus]